MGLILLQRVIKLMFFIVENLCPFLIRRVPVNFPLHIFGFHYQHAEIADHNVVDLGCFIVKRQIDIVDDLTMVQQRILSKQGSNLFFSLYTELFYFSAVKENT